MNEVPENPFTEVKCNLFMLDLLAAKDEPAIVERDLGMGWYPSLLVHSHNCGPLLWLLALPLEQASGHIAILAPELLATPAGNRITGIRMWCAWSIGTGQWEQASSVAYV